MDLEKQVNNMNDNLKELIDNVEIVEVGTFKAFMFLSAGKYEGFWGVNGYDNLLILGFDVDKDKWVQITDYGDVFMIYKLSERIGFNVDIPSEYGIPRFWFSKPVHINNSLGVSSVVGELVE